MIKCMKSIIFILVLYKFSAKVNRKGFSVELKCGLRALKGIKLGTAKLHFQKSP